jgi:hypothetical protein
MHARAQSSQWDAFGLQGCCIGNEEEMDGGGGGDEKEEVVTGTDEHTQSK